MVVVPHADYVNWVKRSLNRLSGTELAENGIIDDEYRDVVKNFQGYERIKDDGIVGPITQNHLIRANLLIREYRDWIREVITHALAVTSTGSGSWATVDRDAVRKYQREIGPSHGGLTVDGWVGPRTEFVMYAHSKKKVPSSSTDPIVIDDDDVVIGNKPMTEDEVKAITWTLIGREPGVDWLSGLKVGWSLLKAVGSLGKGSTSAPTPSISDISHGLGDAQAALSEADAMKGMAYGLVDHPFHRVRSNQDLKATNVKGVSTEGFAKGYRKMQSHLALTHVRTTSGGKTIMRAISGELDKARTLKFIYEALFAVYRNRGALGRGHANAIRDAQRHCKFTYPNMSVECGPRDDLLR